MCPLVVVADVCRFEIPERVQLVAEAWTPESDLVTAALKLKRKPIHAKYKEQIAALYAASA